MPLVPPPMPRRPSVGFDRAAALATLVLLVGGVLLVVLGSGALDAVGASLLTFGVLGALARGLAALIERRRLPQRIPLDPDSMRRSRR